MPCEEKEKILTQYLQIVAGRWGERNKRRVRIIEEMEA